jgi:hypothetical protein
MAVRLVASLLPKSQESRAMMQRTSNSPAYRGVLWVYRRKVLRRGQAEPRILPPSDAAVRWGVLPFIPT